MLHLTPMDYQTAIEVQNASNISGVIESFHEVLQKIRDDLYKREKYSTDVLKQHPIIVLYVSKLESMVQSQNLEVFSAAFDECRRNEEYMYQDRT
jgi:predicted RNase H-like nuclease